MNSPAVSPQTDKERLDYLRAIEPTDPRFDPLLERWSNPPAMSFDSIREVIEIAQRLADEDYRRHVAAVDIPGAVMPGAVAGLKDAALTGRIVRLASRELDSAESDFRDVKVSLLDGDQAGATLLAKSSTAHLEKVADHLDDFGSRVPQSKLFAATLNAFAKADKIAGKVEARIATEVAGFSFGIKTFAKRVRNFGSEVAQFPAAVAEKAKTSGISIAAAMRDVASQFSGGMKDAAERSTNKLAAAAASVGDKLDSARSNVLGFGSRISSGTERGINAYAEFGAKVLDKVEQSSSNALGSLANWSLRNAEKFAAHREVVSTQRTIARQIMADYKAAGDPAERDAATSPGQEKKEATPAYSPPSAQAFVVPPTPKPSADLVRSLKENASDRFGHDVQAVADFVQQNHNRTYLGVSESLSSASRELKSTLGDANRMTAIETAVAERVKHLNPVYVKETLARIAENLGRGDAAELNAQASTAREGIERDKKASFNSSRNEADRFERDVQEVADFVQQNHNRTSLGVQNSLDNASPRLLATLGDDDRMKTIDKAVSERVKHLNPTYVNNTMAEIAAATKRATPTPEVQKTEPEINTGRSMRM